MTAFATLTPERFDAPLYEMPREKRSGSAQDFTVTIAGPERHDGEEPYTYVVRDHSTEGAWIQALTWHMCENETLDAFVVVSQSHVGLPPADPGYHWTDLRPSTSAGRRNCAPA